MPKIDLSYRSYISALRARLTPKSLAAAPLEKSQRFPGRFEGTTIITSPRELTHLSAYQFLYDSQNLVANGNEGLVSTPRSSFHMTLLGITHGDLQARLARSGDLSKVMAETNRVLQAYKPKSFIPHYKLAGLFPLKDAVVAGLEPMDARSYQALLDLRGVILNDPVLAGAGVEEKWPALFHVTTHYRVSDKFDRPTLNANLAGVNRAVSSRHGPLVFPVTQLYFSQHVNLVSFTQLTGSPVISFR